MQALELRPRLDADLLDEDRARLAERSERISLAAATVEREQPLGVHALAQWVLGQQSIDLTDDLQ